MLNFNLGNLQSWQQVAIGELLEFEVPLSGHRTVSFDIMADQPVACKAVAGDGYWLVAYGAGEMVVKFSTDRTVGISFQGDPSADVFIRTRVETQVVPESREAPFTSIEPRPAGPSPEVKQMMQIMKLNDLRRQQETRASLQQMQVMADQLRVDRQAFEAERQSARAERVAPPVTNPTELIEGKANGSQSDRSEQAGAAVLSPKDPAASAS